MDIIMNSLRSWKTTFLGFASIVAIVAKWVQAGAVDYNDMPAVIAGIGLILAKDAGVTGAVK
jgi:hypothetical protein